MKRAFDIVVSLLALVLLAPFLALIAIAIKRDTPGPAIYRGERTGLGGRTFKILKFRTMFESPASYAGPKVTAHDDPRVTLLGRWLRNTKLNELLQFWNVLKGDMSLVGPRPEDPNIADGWPVALRAEILSVRPGITSPASVLYRNEETLLCAQDVFRQYIQDVGPDKLRLDQQYVRRRSFCLDLDTLLWTALILVPRIRSSEPPEKLLFVGPITCLIRRYVNWFLIDWLIALFALGCAGLVWRGYGPLNIGWPRAIVTALVFALLFSLTGAVLGVNRIRWSKARPADIFVLLLTWVVAATLVSVTNLLAHALPLGLVFLASIVALGGSVACRYRTRLITGFLSALVRRRAMTANRERVLIVGSGQNARYLAWALEQPGNLQRFQLAGFVDDDLFEQGMRIYGGKVLGTTSDLPALIGEQRIKVIIFAEQLAGTDRCRATAEVCRTQGARFILVPDLIDSLNGLDGGVSVLSQFDGKVGDDVHYTCVECMASRAAADARGPRDAAQVEGT